jgi:DNA mismatch repair protein MutS
MSQTNTKIKKTTTKKKSNMYDYYFYTVMKHHIEYGKMNCVPLFQVGKFLEYYSIKLTKTDEQYLLEHNYLDDCDKDYLSIEQLYFGNPNIAAIAELTGLTLTERSQKHNIYLLEDGNISLIHPDILYHFLKEDFETQQKKNPYTQENNISKKSSTQSALQLLRKHIKNDEDDNMKFDNEDRDDRDDGDDDRNILSSFKVPKIKKEFVGTIYNIGFECESDKSINKYVDKISQLGNVDIPIYMQDEDNPQIRGLVEIRNSGNHMTAYEKNIQITNNIVVLRLSFTNRTKYRISTSSHSSKASTLHVSVASIDTITYENCFYSYQSSFTNTSNDYDELDIFISAMKPKQVIVLMDEETVAIDTLGKHYVFNETYVDTIQTFIEQKVDRFKTCIIPKSIREFKKKNIFNSLQDNVTMRVYNSQHNRYQNELIHTLFGLDPNHFFNTTGIENDYEKHAYFYMLDLFYGTNKNTMKNIPLPYHFKTNQNITIGNHSYKQLNYIVTEQGQKFISSLDITQRNKNKLNCVVDLLNQCKTKQGKRYFNRILLSPMQNIERLNHMYETTQYILDNYNELLPLYMMTSNICDLREHICEINSGKHYSSHKLNRFMESLKQTNSIYDQLHFFISKNETGSSSFIDMLFYRDEYNNEVDDDREDILNELEPTIQTIQDMLFTQEEKQTETQRIHSMFYNECFQDTALENEINDIMNKCIFSFSSNEDVRNIVSKLIAKLKHVYNLKVYISDCIYQNECKASKKYDKSKILSNYCVLNFRDKEEMIEFTVTETRSKSFVQYIKSKGHTYKDDAISFNPQQLCVKTAKTKGKKIITSDEIYDFCNEYFTLKQEYNDIIKKCYNNLILLLRENNNIFNHCASFISIFDVEFTKAYISKVYNYCRPHIKPKDNDMPYINATEIRHPLIEHLTTDHYTTNNVYIDHENTMLLYGTNAVGKSSLIKSIALNLIMAQCGLYVPSTEFTYSPYSSIYTRIISNDNIFQGKSTFAAEMTELGHILKNSNTHSIIFGDELCSGTEHRSASAIVIAGLQRFVEKKSTFLFATHFHDIIETQEFKQLQHVNVYHLSVIHDAAQNKLIFDRKLKNGSGNGAYGIEVLKSIGLDDAFIEQCYINRNSMDSQFNHKQSNRSICESKPSRYNTQKISHRCEECGSTSNLETHHKHFQKNADDSGFVGTHHKNVIGNLQTLCSECHNKKTIEDKEEDTHTTIELSSFKTKPKKRIRKKLVKNT